MNLLVTGGAGFIGSNFAHHVIDHAEHQVTVLDALTYAGQKSNLENILDHPRLTFIEGDIRDRELVEDIIEDAEVVVNFAAESHVDRSIQTAEPFVSTNVQGTQTLLDAAVATDLNCFVQMSTDEVYGEIIDGTFSEGDCLTPRNPYAATKAAADHLAMSYHETHDLPVVIARPSNNYGPRQHKEKLIPKLITRAIDGKSLPLYGDGTNVREWLYVEDTCRAILHLIEQGSIGEIYNIGSGEERQNIQVAEEVIDEIGASEELIEFVEDRPGHDQRYALDTAKIRELGWYPRYDFQEGIEKTVRHYRQKNN